MTNIESPAEPRRGVVPEPYKCDKFELSIQQKRYLEYRIEKEKLDKEEVQENYHVLSREFTRYKDVSLEKQAELKKENEHLKRQLDEANTRLVELRSEAAVLKRQLDDSKDNVTTIREFVSEKVEILSEQVKRAGAKEKQLAKAVQLWMERSEDAQKKVATQYESLVERVFSLAAGSVVQTNCSRTVAAADTPHHNSNQALARVCQPTEEGRYHSLGLTKMSSNYQTSASKTTKDCETARSMMDIMGKAVMLPPRGRGHCKVPNTPPVTWTTDDKSEGMSGRQLTNGDLSSTSKENTITTTDRSNLTENGFNGHNGHNSHAREGCKKKESQLTRPFFKFPFGRKDPSKRASKYV